MGWSILADAMLLLHAAFIVWVALDGDGRIEEWNDSIARLTGHAAEAVVGRSFAVLLPARSEGLALSGVLADECAAVLQEFFAGHR